MPWHDRGLDREKESFVVIASSPGVNVSEACRRHFISRKTGYKWLGRYREQGAAGLQDRKRTPRSSPMQVRGEIVLRIVRLRNEHPRWGPKKLRALLMAEGLRAEEVPSKVTVARILKKAGLTEPKGRGRRRVSKPDGVLGKAQEANEIWTVDFKGWWRTGDGKRCEPLTVCDLYSRYILCLKPMARRNTESVKAVFEELFGRYGLPKRIRSDNGAPFASTSGPQGLTRLSAWWLWLGIEPERIQPGHPEQNGTHERMHRDVAPEIEGQPGETIERETERLEAWRMEYNTMRPHEALDQRRPADLYKFSARRLRKPSPESRKDILRLRRVRKDGTIKVDGVRRFVSEVLKSYDVELKPVECDQVEVWFCNLCLGVLDREQATPLRPPASATSPAKPEASPMS
jgi:putative transposase